MGRDEGESIVVAYDEFLTPLFKSCSDAELDDIVNILLKNSFGKLKKDPAFQTHGGFSPSKYTGSLIKEIQRVGGNSFANVLRGEGVTYSEIVQDVARKIGLKKNEISTSADKTERAILAHFIEKAYENMTEEQKEKFEEEFYKQDYSEYSNIPSGAISLAFIQTTINSSGFLAYKLSVMIANTVAKQLLGHGLRLGINAGLVRALSIFAGPAGIAFTSLWAAIDLAGPAYRVTIPIVVFIATLRMKKNVDSKESSKKKPKRTGSNQDAYSILGVDPSSDDKTIKDSYFNLMKLYHPDNHTNADPKVKKKNNKLTAEINAAYEKIKNERGIK